MADVPPSDPLPSASSTAESGTTAAATVETDSPKKGENEGFLPRLDIYFPEGKLDLRLSRLIKNAFFEGQMKYNFIRGDISAFLRYRYYGYRRIYQLGLFDVVEFDDVRDIDSDFERVRGMLFLIEQPHSYYNRTFVVTQLERLSSSKEEFRFDNNQTNTFVRLGFQRGTSEDARSNAIVGETRARSESLLTAHREIGPWKAGFTVALTYSFDFAGADFDYLKFEFEGLKRIDLGRESFTIARLHGGSFLAKKMAQNPAAVDPIELYTIPVGELFRLDGRENLKGIDDELRGTEELHTTFEVFTPWFLDQDRRFLGLRWNTFYWVFYGGFGTVGFAREVLTDLDRYYPDLGIGFEAAFGLTGYTFFVSGLLAQAQRGEHDVQAQLTIRSYR